MQIKLTNGHEATIDFSDYYKVAGRVWRAMETHTGPVYACTGRNTLMHQLIRPAKPGEDVDHVDGNGLNNRWSNLRSASRGQNMMNANYAPGVSGYRGVAPNGLGWEARVQAEGVVHLLGTYDTPEEAARVRDEAALRLHGKFARLNFPSTKFVG